MAIILSLSTLLLYACATPQIIQEPVTDPGKRHQFESFSFLPPQGDSWFLIFSKEQSGEALLMFGKEVKPGTPLGIKSFQPHTIRAGLTATQYTGNEDVGSPQNYLDMIKQSEQANISNSFVVLEEKYSPYKMVGEYCVLVENMQKTIMWHQIPAMFTSLYLRNYSVMTATHRCWSKFPVVSVR